VFSILMFRLNSGPWPEAKNGLATLVAPLPMNLPLRVSRAGPCAPVVNQVPEFQTGFGDEEVEGRFTDLVVERDSAVFDIERVYFDINGAPIGLFLDDLARNSNALCLGILSLEAVGIDHINRIEGHVVDVDIGYFRRIFDQPSLAKVPPEMAMLTWWLAVVTASMGTSATVYWVSIPGTASSKSSLFPLKTFLSRSKISNLARRQDG
jgi:hypothetical protein